MLALSRWRSRGSLALLAALAFSTPAAARHLDILEVLPNFPESGQLSIRVRGFPRFGPARAHVCLGESTVPLESTVVDPTEIRAVLPVGLPTGTYRLTLRAVLPNGSAQCPDRVDSESVRFDAVELALSDPSALEIEHALCEGGAPNPRPGICPGRCGCAPASLGPGCTFAQVSGGEFLYELRRTAQRGVCRMRVDGNRCSASSGGRCLHDADCSGGQQCVPIPGTTDEAECRFPCASDADCGPIELVDRTRYLGVGAAGSRNLVACERSSGGDLSISNNDALACIAQLERACGP
jgi:hypothetical protein